MTPLTDPPSTTETQRRNDGLPPRTPAPEGMSSLGLGPPRMGTAAAADAEVPDFPLPIGPGNIEELDEPDSALASEVTENLAPLPLGSPAGAPTIAMVELEEGEESPAPEPMQSRLEAPDEREDLGPSQSWTADDAAAAPPGPEQSGNSGSAAEGHPLAPLPGKPEDSEPPPISEEDPRDARQSTLKPMISDWEEDRDDARAAAAGTYRQDRPPRATRGLRPIPRPAARPNRRFLLLAGAGLLSGLAVFGALSLGGARSTEAAIEASLLEAPVSPENVTAGDPPPSAAAPLPGPASPGPEAEPPAASDIPVAAEAPVAAEVAAAAEVPVAAESHAPATAAPVAPQVWLRCPPHSCERFGDLVMVNRGPLKLYSDPACKKPAAGMMAAGQTILATGADCFAVNQRR